MESVRDGNYRFWILIYFQRWGVWRHQDSFKRLQRGDPLKIITERGVSGAFSLVFGSFWGDPPVILQGDPPPSKRVVMWRPLNCLQRP